MEEKEKRPLTDNSLMTLTTFDDNSDDSDDFVDFREIVSTSNPKNKQGEKAV